MRAQTCCHPRCPRRRSTPRSRQARYCSFRAITAALEQPLPATALWPIRAVLQPLFASDAAAWWRALPWAVLVLAVHYLGVLRLDLAFEEAALEATEGRAITDRSLLVRSLAVAGLTIAGFLVHSALGLEAATIALAGATVLMLVARLDPHETLREVEWSTLFFFVGLFVDAIKKR